MYRNFTSRTGGNAKCIPKVLLISQRIAFILIITFIQVSASAFGQKITLSGKEAALKVMLNEVSRQSGYNILYSGSAIKPSKPVNIRVSNMNLKDVMDKLLDHQPLGYTIYGKTITIAPKEEKDNTIKSIVEQQFEEIKGRVVDEEGNPVRDVTITVKGKKKICKTDENGAFVLNSIEKNDILLISCLGYKTQEIIIGKQQILNIKLTVEERMMKDVVITGMFERRKQSFSGSSASFTGQQLRDIGTQNVIQSLRTLDPSFVVIDNNLNGSNPNTLASIELRGKTSINTELNKFGDITNQLTTDPNQPLFVLDGFESTLRQVMDLDMNRIANITILKDAASTALYGSRSANGVIIIETIKPKPGALRISYTGNYTVEVPDLRDYNMMNSEQKLEFERLAGMYTHEYGEIQLEMQRRYNDRLRAVREGVNTYWLNEPLRTGLTQKHAIYTNGGNNEFQFGVGVDYQDINGAMKGSGRNNWAGRADLNYRTKKLNISNRVYISGYKSNESEYGSFSDYVKINPFFKKGNEDRYFEKATTGDFKGMIMDAPNPLYNAIQNSYNFNKNTYLQNYLQFNWDLDKSIRISGGFQLKKTFGSKVDFVSPQHTKFDGSPTLQKGSYAEVNSESLSYDGNMMLSYNKVFGLKHVITANARGDIHHAEGTSKGFIAVGFPSGVKGNPAFANSYQTNSKPIVKMPPTIRWLNALGSINYVYNDRYFVDATYRLDGSTAFGSENRYSPFWSVGIGWSLQKEQFLKEVNWLNMLTLRTNIGSTGNQQFGSFASTTIYDLENNTNFFGQGIFHNSLGNPALKWQKTLQSNLGLDFSIFDNRFSGTVNAYRKRTDPLIVTIDLPPSNGVANYPINTGYLTIKGVEGTFRYSIINNLSTRTIWTVGLTGSTYKSTYGGFNNTLNTLNEKQQKSKSIIRYRDGNSPDDIWVVPSIGIDPATGEELFLKQNGLYTFEYNPNDVRIVASLRPKAEGVISSTLRLKGLTLAAYVRYRLGASIINRTLYEKVENLDLEDIAYNQDIRALESRWKVPGDIVQFKGIRLNSQTDLSSRFVQKENMFNGESFSAGYEFQAATSPWLKKAKFQSLRLTAFMNNVFRISNIRAERGINYPFANSASFSINASF